jgi:heat shock protein HtpX
VLNDDVRTVTLAVATAGLVALLADILVRYMWLGGRQRSSNNNNAAQLLFVAIGLLAVIIAPLVARLIRYAVARQREYLADATAAELLRDPQSMVNALRRIDENPTVLMKFDVATAHLWFEEPNAIDGETKAAKFARRFATHPSIRQRIERLATLNAGMVSLDQPLAPHQPKQANTDPRDDDPPPPPPSPFSPFDPLFPRGSS